MNMLPVEQDGPCLQEDDALGRVVGVNATWSVDEGTAAGLAAQTTTGRTCGGSPRGAQTCWEGYSSGYVQAATTLPIHHQDTGWEKKTFTDNTLARERNHEPSTGRTCGGSSRTCSGGPIWTKYGISMLDGLRLKLCIPIYLLRLRNGNYVVKYTVVVK